jgi:hypothetical protein
MSMGAMPDDTVDIGEAELSNWNAAIVALPVPLTDDEAIGLLNCFPADDGLVFGVAWSLLHAVETAPYGPHLLSQLDQRSPWRAILWERASRAGLL